MNEFILFCSRFSVTLQHEKLFDYIVAGILLPLHQLMGAAETGESVLYGASYR